uniref:Secreted protein n=1 Tax=Utricularia reniformis TaxID=192314 RepID=A0A1Y0B2Q5_9LAMI|nr:hypothetical protein AEK19_MT1462 [Utricularia reniformis]ART31653.1 hypothetical protein AEK19_MT1462 [Utricularia reniformis]
MFSPLLLLSLLFLLPSKQRHPHSLSFFHVTSFSFSPCGLLNREMKKVFLLQTLDYSNRIVKQGWMVFRSRPI